MQTLLAPNVSTGGIKCTVVILSENEGVKYSMVKFGKQFEILEVGKHLDYLVEIVLQSLNIYSYV